MKKKQQNNGRGADNILQNRFTAYVERALKNNLIKYNANRSNQNVVELYENMNDVIDEKEVFSDTDAAFDAAFGSEFDSFEDLTLFSVLRTLDEKDRTIIKLRIIYDYSYAQIGVVMGMSLNAVRVRYIRARDRIRDRMEKSK